MDDSTGVWILGGYQSDFARNLTKEGRDFAALTAEVVDATLKAAKVDAADVEVVHVGNAFGEEDVNIVSAAVGAEHGGGGDAVMALTTDAPVRPDALETILALDGFSVGRSVDL